MKSFLFRLALVVLVSIAAAWYAATAWNSLKMRREFARAEAAEKAEAQRVAQILAQIKSAVGSCDEVVIEQRKKGKMDDLELRFADPEWIKSIAAILEHATCVSAKIPPAGVMEPIIDRSPYVRFYRNKVLSAEIDTDGRIVSASELGRLVLDKSSAYAIHVLVGSRTVGD